jgi:hypothetical protein
LAYLFDLEVAEVFECLGHNASEKPFTYSELQHFSLTEGYILTRFDHDGNKDRLYFAINCHNNFGILLINKGSDLDHAVVLCRNVIMDPADGSTSRLSDLRHPVAAYYMVTELEMQ